MSLQEVKGETSRVWVFKDIVIKEQTAFLEYDLLCREKTILSVLDKYHHFPKVRLWLGKILGLSYCGVPVIKATLPDDWEVQLAEIHSALVKEKIIHRDVRPENFLIKDCMLYLIDFGWAILKDEPPFGPDCIGDKFKSPTGWDDNYSFQQVVNYWKHIND